MHNFKEEFKVCAFSFRRWKTEYK